MNDLDKALKNILNNSIEENRKIDAAAIDFAKEFITERLSEPVSFTVFIRDRISSSKHVKYVMDTDIVDDAFTHKHINVVYSYDYRSFEVTLVDFSDTKTYYLPEENEDDSDQ